MYHFLKVLCRVLFFFLFRVKIIGEQNFQGSAILCANHRSLLDPIIISCVMKRKIYYMAKSELFDDHGKLFAWLLKSVGTFPVARGSADKSAVLKAEKLLDDGCIVGIFPQGKIVNDETSFKIKAGASLLAMRAGVPIIPVSIYFEGKIRPFKKLTVRIGDTIQVEKENGTCAKKCRFLSERLSKTIETLLEVKHENNFSKVSGILFRSEQSRYDSK